MMITLALCAVICAATLLWVLAPARTAKAFYIVAFISALASLGLYLTYGRPDLPEASAAMGKGAAADYRAMVLQEFELVKHLSENPDDADAMIKLAAVRLAQGRAGEETLRLLDRAQTLRPKDKRIEKIKKLLKAD